MNGKAIATAASKRDGSVISDDDQSSSASKKIYFDFVNKSEKEKIIDSKKANRLRECLNSNDVVLSLLKVNIPDKRPGKGYKCRVCQVPVKGHLCPYCPVCSTHQMKFNKNKNHNCRNCVKCYDEGKMRKKLVQLAKQDCKCR